MIPNIDIRAQDYALIAGILRASLPKAASVFVFGSRAKGIARRGSDLDLAIDAGQPLTRAQMITLSDELEESDLPYTVDITDLQSISPSFKSMIAATQVPFAFSSDLTSL